MANRSKISSLFRVIAMLTVLALVSAGALIFLQATTRGVDPSVELAALSQAVAVEVEQALRSEPGSFERLERDLARMRELRANAPAIGVSGNWGILDTAASTMLAARPDIEQFNDAARAAASSAGEVLALSDPLLELSGSTAAIQDFQLRVSRLARTPAGLAAEPDLQALTFSMIGDANYLADVVAALGGAPSRLDVSPLDDASAQAVLVPIGGHLTNLSQATEALDISVEAVIPLASQIGVSRNASAALLDHFTVVVGDRPSLLPEALQTHWIPIGFVATGFLLILILFILNAKSAVFERSAREQAEQNERNQAAILRLLDEMGSLADGDLTVEATVSEDITGTIADSFNYAIEELRSLVTTVNETAIMVDSAAKQTESTAAHMARAAENQTKEISAASKSIEKMATSIEEVSGNAERSSDVARHSVDIAHKGGEAVRRTIDGMNTIRETIQETSKRIKRLGESSQEIGNIVELINDIAEQTNILALNASIQASMAGEAGRGFAVVADEVQRLAERSTNATRQIEVLVSTIQADTKEAVVSMERSTTDVVGGALLAENAGAALDEIEQVSNQIANLVQNISGSAKEQASAAADVTKRTKRLSDISTQTGKATTATAAAISKLAEFASQLRHSVAGFTLPAATMPDNTVQVTAKEIAAGGKKVKPQTKSAPPENQPAPPRDKASAG